MIKNSERARIDATTGALTFGWVVMFGTQTLLFPGVSHEKCKIFVHQTRDEPRPDTPRFRLIAPPGGAAAQRAIPEAPRHGVGRFFCPGPARRQRRGPPLCPQARQGYARPDAPPGAR